MAAQTYVTIDGTNCTDITVDNRPIYEVKIDGTTVFQHTTNIDSYSATTVNTNITGNKQYNNTVSFRVNPPMLKYDLYYVTGTSLTIYDKNRSALVTTTTNPYSYTLKDIQYYYNASFSQARKSFTIRKGDSYTQSQVEEIAIKAIKGGIKAVLGTEYSLSSGSISLTQSSTEPSGFRVVNFWSEDSGGAELEFQPDPVDVTDPGNYVIYWQNDDVTEEINISQIGQFSMVLETPGTFNYPLFLTYAFTPIVTATRCSILSSSLTYTIDLAGESLYISGWVTDITGKSPKITATAMLCYFGIDKE